MIVFSRVEMFILFSFYERVLTILKMEETIMPIIRKIQHQMFPFVDEDHKEEALVICGL